MRNLNGAVEDAAEANSVFENLVDLHYGVVGFVAAAVGDVVDMEYDLRHLKFSASLSPSRFRFNSKNPSRPRIFISTSKLNQVE